MTVAKVYSVEQHAVRDGVTVVTLYVPTHAARHLRDGVLVDVRRTHDPERGCELCPEWDADTWRCDEQPSGTSDHPTPYSAAPKWCPMREERRRAEEAANG